MRSECRPPWRFCLDNHRRRDYFPGPFLCAAQTVHGCAAEKPPLQARATTLPLAPSGSRSSTMRNSRTFTRSNFASAVLSATRTPLAGDLPPVDVLVLRRDLLQGFIAEASSVTGRFHQMLLSDAERAAFAAQDHPAMAMCSIQDTDRRNAHVHVREFRRGAALRSRFCRRCVFARLGRRFPTSRN